MLKRIVLGVVVLALLAGTGILIAQEDEDTPKAEQKQESCAKQKRPGFRRWQERPIEERFNKWFNNLTKAYEENDREKMGQLLKKMEQQRQKQREKRGAGWERRRNFCKRLDAGRGQIGRFHAGPKRWRRGFHRRGMGRWGPGMLRGGIHSRGMSRRRPGMPLRGMGGPGPSLPPRDMGRWEQDMPVRDFDWDW